MKDFPAVTVRFSALDAIKCLQCDSKFNCRAVIIWNGQSTIDCFQHGSINWGDQPAIWGDHVLDRIHDVIAAELAGCPVPQGLNRRLGSDSFARGVVHWAKRTEPAAGRVRT